ncbi:NASP-related protein sim3 [Vanrija pseudolonga]|uniref:NASP-related protein sim3 n=1 Tax=Vanrija pseudolonga TaxID=143232 RepID=A0AAF1BHW8_9TREE|nr:NASP-related protein sim3 [Vanrija pseudolonga]
MKSSSNGKSPAPAEASTSSPKPDDLKAQVAKLVAEGKKAIALKQWEEGVAKYADALDIQRQLVGDFDPAMAPLLLSYGRALYELALSQQGVMGKEEVAKGTDPAAQSEQPAAGPSSGNFVFEGDSPDDDEEEEEGDAADGEDEAPAAGGDGEGEDGDLEDDFNAAWEVLDVARTIYTRAVEALPADQGKDDRLLLSECYLTLGDISLETENFPQAVQDYTEAVKIKSALLPASSRALASAHYQLGTVLEFTPAGRSEALKHVQLALDGFKQRETELKSGETKSEDIARLNAKERDAEAKDVAALIGDLEVKIDELKAAPPAADFVAESINHLLGGVSSSAAPVADSGPVNDLTSMVRKKAPKKAAPAPAPANGDKRKADEQPGSAEKKARAE